METQENDQMEKWRAALAEFNQAWQDVQSAILELQKATENCRQSLLEIAPEVARDPRSWRMLDPLLYLEELTLQAGRIVADVEQRPGDSFTDETS
jgi:hypothetical protein